MQGVRTFGFYNAGQDSVLRRAVYAQRGIYDALVAVERGEQPEKWARRRMSRQSWGR